MEGSYINEPVKIFFPHNCLSASSGYLIGWQDIGRRFCCVTGVLHGPIHSITDSAPYLLPWQSQAETLVIVGLWENTYGSSSSHDCTKLPSEYNWTSLQKCDQELPLCTLEGKWQGLNGHQHKSIVIIYDALSVMTSSFLQEKSWSLINGNSRKKTEDQPEFSSLQKNVDLLTKSLLIHTKSAEKISKSDLLLRDALARRTTLKTYIDRTAHTTVHIIFGLSTALVESIRTQRWKRFTFYYQNIFC